MTNHESTAEIRSLSHDEIESVSGSANITTDAHYDLGFGIGMTVHVDGDVQTVCVTYNGVIKGCGDGPAPK